MDLQINIPLFRTTMVGHHGSDVNFVDPWHPLDPLCQGRKGWEIPLMTNKSSLFYMWDPCEIQLTNSLLSPESCCGKWHKTSWPRRCFVPRRREKKHQKTEKNHSFNATRSNGCSICSWILWWPRRDTIFKYQRFSVPPFLGRFNKIEGSILHRSRREIFAKDLRLCFITLRKKTSWWESGLLTDVFLKSLSTLQWTCLPVSEWFHASSVGFCPGFFEFFDISLTTFFPIGQILLSQQKTRLPVNDGEILHARLKGRSPGV